MKLPSLFLLVGLLSIGISHAALVEESSLSIDYLTIFTNTETAVTIDLVWDDVTAFDATQNLTYTINGDGETKDYVINLEEANELPSQLDVIFVTKKGGRVDVTVDVLLGEEMVTSASNSYQAYGEGASLVPLIMILILGFSTRIIELSLGAGVFIGACMVSGNVQDGFTSTLENYILGAVADGGHAYVYMFTAFLGGFVALLEKSGGFAGFAKAISTYAKGSRSGQFVAYLAGGIIFFDDYANCLVVGGSLRPILDMLSVSREKLAFIVDATAAPIASLVPVSSWVGYEIGLIQDEINKIIEGLESEDDLYIKSSGYAVFLDSIKYRYYSIYMLYFIPILILLKRDFGPMLVAERKTVIYNRTDGGDGKDDKMNLGNANAPKDDTPGLAWNFFIPLFFLIFFIFYILVMSGDDGSGEQSFMDKIESSDSYVALLYGTMAAALLAMTFYLVQFKIDGKLAMPTPKSFLLFCGLSEHDNGETPVPIVTIKEGVESFIYGHIKVFPALIVLTLAWSAGSIMKDVGADRLFERWILDSGLSAGALPTLSFLIAMLIALCTGTSWGTMAILFPLLLGPTYTAAMGDARIFNATVSGILAGSIMGDHISPISDTTILACIASECGLMEHVKTQLPYAGVVALWSILFGTLPIGYSPRYPSAVANILGLIMMFLSAYLIGVPVVSESGKFDLGTEIFMKFNKNSELHKIKEDTIEFSKSSVNVADAVPTKEESLEVEP